MEDVNRGYGERIRQGIQGIRGRGRDFRNGVYEIPDRRKLGISMVLDGIGLIEMGPVDPLYGAAQGAWIWLAYDDVPGAIGSLVEESLPFTDIVPSCTAAHIRYRNRMDEERDEGD